MIAHTNGKSECPLLFALSKISSKPNFVKYSLTQAMVPIGTDLLLFGSRTNVLSRKCFCVTTELIRSGHFYLTSSVQYRYLIYIRSCRAQVPHIISLENGYSVSATINLGKQSLHPRFRIFQSIIRHTCEPELLRIKLPEGVKDSF